ISYPAAYQGSVAVAATGKEGKRSFYSNWGKDLDISAPGGDQSNGKEGGVLQNTIMVGDPAHNDYLWFQGTSMASPHAAGVAGLIVSAGVDNPKEVERILKETARHPNKVEWDKEYGAGIIDAEAAVIAAGKSYQDERLGFAGLLGLLGLTGVGLGRRREGDGPAPSPSQRLLTVAGLVGGVGLGAGLLVTPLAYVAGTSLGLMGSGLFLSALVPAVLTLLLLQVKSLRGLLTGLNLGWAALLLHGAVVLPTLVAGIPGGAGWDRLWLAANACVALYLARKINKLSE
ncbi:MAG: S8 family serine peptidase, partial [Myxococcales bacterium]|nr:S8 family serine peptidase [Myxococcales bacterium]